MNRLFLCFAAALFLCVPTSAQDQQRGPHQHYEQLKVLDHLVGTFQWEGTRRDQKFVMSQTYAWQGNKRFLSMTSKVKMGDQEWIDIIRNQYFYWNPDAERIEQIIVEGRGMISINEVKLPGDAVLETTRLSGNGGPSPTVTMTLTDDGMTVKLTNWRNREGEPREDREINIKRVDVE